MQDGQCDPAGIQALILGKASDMKTELRELFAGELVKKEVPKVVFNPVQVSVLLSVHGQGAGRAVASVPTFQELQGDPPQQGKGCRGKLLMWSRKFGTWFSLLSRKAEDLGQEEGGFVLGQGGLTSFTLAGRNSLCQEDSRQSQKAEAPPQPEFLMP